MQRHGRVGMTTTTLLASVVAILILLIPAAAFAQAGDGTPPGQQMRFADQIKVFLDQDRTAPPPKEAILFIGSSIFRQWTNVKEHMAPLPVFNRAFGGSRTWEVLHYMDQVVLPYRPRIIVYYTGSNDVTAGEAAPAIVGRVKAFISKAHASLPETLIYFVAINRSPPGAVRCTRRAADRAIPGRRAPFPPARLRPVRRDHQAGADRGVAEGRFEASQVGSGMAGAAGTRSARDAIISPWQPAQAAGSYLSGRHP
jgi:hypothetical protein